MNKREEILASCQGIVLAHYDFTNKEGIHINTTKALFNINGLGVYINSKSLNSKKIGTKLLLPIYYDGKQFYIDDKDVLKED